MIDFNIAALLEREERRKRALAAGSTHIHASRRQHDGIRPDAVSERDVPELLWPSERHRVPERCPHCAVGRANFEYDEPYGATARGRVTCWVCSRPVARLRDDKTRPVPLTHEQIHPRRGRPPAPKPAVQPAPTVPTPLCVDCQRRRAKPKRLRCQPCAAARASRGREVVYTRLLAALASGPHDGRALAGRLGVSPDRVRHLIHLARERGAAIVTERRCYRLEAVS